MRLDGAMKVAKTYRTLHYKAMELVDYLASAKSQSEYRILDKYSTVSIDEAQRWFILANYSVEKIDSFYRESEVILKLLHEYKQKHKQRWASGGFVLVLVMLITLLLLAMGIGLAIIAVAEMQAVKNAHDYMQAFNYAEAGIEYGRAMVRDTDNLTMLLTLQNINVPPPANGPAVITLSFSDNYDDTPDDPFTDQDCRIRLRSVASYPKGTKNPTTVEIRAKTGPQSEDKEQPCMESVKVVGWEEISS